MAVPAAWAFPELGEIAETSLGKMLDRGRSRGLSEVPYLRNINVQWSRIDTDSVLTMELADDERERFGLRTGDLLVCEGGEIGRAAIWQASASYMAYQKALHRVRPSPAVEARFLLHLFAHYASNGYLQTQATGSTIQHLPQQQLRRLRVPLPTIAAQRRIVDILEDHLSRLDAAGASVASGCRRLELLQMSALAKTWDESDRTGDWMRVGDLGPVATGSTPPTRSGEVFGGEMPFVTPSDVRHGEVIAAWKRTLSSRGAEAARVLPAGSVIAVCIGATLGKVGWVAREVAANQQINGVTPRSNLARPDYVAALMASQPFQRAMAETASSTTMPILNKSRFSSLPIPIVKLELQPRILRDLDAWRDVVDRQVIEYELVQRKRDGLRRALLQAAFAGRLTGASMDSEIVEELAGV